MSREGPEVHPGKPQRKICGYGTAGNAQLADRQVKAIAFTVRDDLLLHAAQNNVLLAPVKLQRITGFEMQGDEGMQQF